MGYDEDKWKKLSVVGHSLGAHIAGFAGKSVKKGKIGTIIGLDPGLLVRFEYEKVLSLTF